MTRHTEDGEGEALRNREALVAALLKHGGTDMVVNYYDVARAFPSLQPNSLSFEAPLINFSRLRQWADESPWEVKMAPEVAAAGIVDRPPIRFTKRSR